MVSAFVMVFISLLLAYALSEILKRTLGFPRVVGQVGAGLILGITLLKPILFNPETLEVLSFLANLGILLLFYYIGLEINFRVFTKNIKGSVLISLFNTTLPFIIGFAVMKWIFHFPTIISLVFGVALSVSAQSVSLGLLEELKLVKSKIGSLIISAGAVDDLIELALVGILLSIFRVATSDISLTRLAAGIFFFVMFIIVARLWLIPYVLKFFDREKSSTSRFTGSLLIVLLIASLSEYLGIGLLIGAMVAGMVVRQTIYRDLAIPDWEEHDIARSVHIIAFGFLIPLFYVWVGLNTELASIITEWLFVLILLVIALVGTVGGSAIAVLLRGGSLREGMILGWGLLPKGDVELAIATLALNAGILTPILFTSLVLMSLSTTIISPIMFKLFLKSKKVLR